MAEMNMNEIIHAAVRRDLARMEGALRSFPEGDLQRAEQLQRAWASLWEQLHHHHRSEDAYVWPYVRRLGVLDPDLVDQMEAEHAAMAEAMTAATGAIEALVASPTVDAARAAADQVAEAARVTDEHLQHEESAVMPTIMERQETPEWKAVEKQLRKAPPLLAGRMFAWVQDGAGPEEVAALRATVPTPVLFVFSRVLGRSYHRDVAPAWR
jgi:hemerythrin-like domain-containing protein